MATTPPHDVHAHVWALDASSYQLWLLRPPRCTQMSSRNTVVDACKARLAGFAGNYYGMLGISAAADASEINTAYRRHAFGCHPDKIPSSDSDEVTVVGSPK